MRAKPALSFIWQASSTNYLPHYNKVDVEVKYMKYCVLFLSTHSFDFLSQLGLDIGSDSSLQRQTSILSHQRDLIQAPRAKPSS
jgi:hypothetical protein